MKGNKMESATAKQHSHNTHRQSKKSHQQNDYFSQQKNFGDWTNLLEPPITFAEVLTKVTVTPAAPNGFIAELEKEYKQLTATVVTAQSW
jgi:hypothetical protein